MNISTKLLKAAAGQGGGASLDVDDVFSIDLWDGTGSYSAPRAEQTITNGIDFSTEGGMVYIKARQYGNRGGVFSTPELGLGNFLYTYDTHAKNSNQTSNTYLHTGPNQYNTDGFKLGDERDGWGLANDKTDDYVGYSFRKAKGWFDIVTWTGDGTSNRSISHNLGTKPGAIIMKRTDATDNWYVGCWNGMPHSNGWKLNTTDSVSTYGYFGSNAPTSTSFEIANFNGANASGGTYIAYLFAHHNGDGTFGPDGDQDVIKCGSYTGNGSSTGPSINLGFEPQWVLIKLASGSGENWILMDNMRGMPVGGNDTLFEINDSGAEKSTSEILNLTATGFDIKSTSNGINTNNQTYIYMAIRRGPLAAPEDATKVFDVSGSTNSNVIPTGFNVDMNINTTTNAQNNHLITRLMGNRSFKTNANSAESDRGSVKWFNDLSNHINLNTSWWSTNADLISWSWKRAPSYFDVCCYSGSSGTQNISHNLGVQPEMIWIKNRDSSDLWVVQVTSLGARKYLNLNGTGAAVSLPTWNGKDYFANTLPTASVFTVGGGSGYDPVGSAGYNYIAYLFATVAGVSKVGSYTGNGSSQTIDCGFSSGARFVLIKRTDASGDWWIFDTVRGIVTGNDSYLALNSNIAENAYGAGDNIDPNSTGFTINQEYLTQANASGGSYLFYAIA